MERTTEFQHDKYGKPLSHSLEKNMFSGENRVICLRLLWRKDGKSNYKNG